MSAAFWLSMGSASKARLPAQLLKSVQLLWTCDNCLASCWQKNLVKYSKTVICWIYNAA